jgi:hypothetical protein
MHVLREPCSAHIRTDRIKSVSLSLPRGQQTGAYAQRPWRARTCMVCAICESSPGRNLTGPTLWFWAVQETRHTIDVNSRTDKHIGPDIHSFQSALTQLQHYWSRRSKTWVSPVVICAQTQRENVLVSFTLLTHAWNGKKTKEWDGRGAHSYTDGKDSPSAPKTKRKCVSILCIAEGKRRWAFHNKFQWGWEWALTSWKTSCRRPDAVETQKRVSFMSQKGRRGDTLRHAGHGKKTKEWDGRGVHSYYTYIYTYIYIYIYTYICIYIYISYICTRVYFRRIRAYIFYTHTHTHTHNTHTHTNTPLQKTKTYMKNFLLPEAI